MRTVMGAGGGLARGGGNQVIPCNSHATRACHLRPLADVDGTLIHSVGTNANKLHKDAFAHAIKTVFGVDTNIDVIKCVFYSVL
jgi:hypothetical protein